MVAVTHSDLVVQVDDVSPHDARKSYPRERICGHPGCGTHLSIYNDGTKCSLHEDKTAPRTRGRRI